MTDITIPFEALEAAAKVMWKTDDPSQWELGMARAACLAMLAAWPGMEWKLYWRSLDEIILPLPKENINDQA